MTRDSALKSLLDGLALTFEREGRAGGTAASAALRAVRIESFGRREGKASPRALVERACLQEGALPLSAVVAECRDLLGWTHWGEGALADAISGNLYTTELLGPDGCFFDEDVRVGLLVCDSHTDYPLSRHAGEETYLVISGVAEWCVPESGYVEKVPGSLVHHPAWTPHGRRTNEECFLGAWRWSGDLDLSSFTVD